MPVLKCAAAILVSVSLALGVLGCNGGSGSKALKSWNDDVVVLLQDAGRGSGAFKPKPPNQPIPRPPTLDLAAISATGKSIGDAADSAALQLSEATELTFSEAKSLYCYWFSWYLDSGYSPEEAGFETFAIGYLYDRLLSSIPQWRLESAISLFEAAITEAQDADEASALVAQATLCSAP